MRATNYVFNTENLALNIKPNKYGELFKLEGISDSNFTDDKTTTISVYGYIINFCGVSIAWKSISGKSVTLSSTEAEYFAIKPK